MRSITLLIAVLLVCIIMGCNSTSITPLVLSDIQGPAQISERTTTQYSVDASGDRNPTFQWVLEPGGIGYLTGDTTTTVTLHTYELTGDCEVELTLLVETTKLGTVVQSIDINVIDSNEPPVAQAVCDKPKIGDGQYVLFTDESTDPDGALDIYNWEWDFSYDSVEGFNTESLEPDPNQQFPVVGIFDVQLRVTDSAGHMDLLDEPIAIEVVANTQPQITSVNHTRTTSQAGNNDEAVHLEVLFMDELPVDDSWEFAWDCDYGSFDDPTSQTPIWYPPDMAVDCDIRVRVTDWFDLYDDSSVHQWVTTLAAIDNPNAVSNTIIPRNMPSGFSGSINPASFTWPDTQPYGNVIFMGFWATWSSASIADMSALNGIYNLFTSDDYYHIYVNQGETAADVVYFVNSNTYDASYWLLDDDASYFGLSNDWAGDSAAIPIYLLFDRDGHCRWSNAGAIGSTASLQLAIEQLL